MKNRDVIPKLNDSTIIYRIIYFIDKCIIIIYEDLSWLLRGWPNEYEILLLAPIGFESTKYPDNYKWP